MYMYVHVRTYVCIYIHMYAGNNMSLQRDHAFV